MVCKRRKEEGKKSWEERKGEHRGKSWKWELRDKERGTSASKGKGIRDNQVEEEGNKAAKSKDEISS
jgi:hypothetical protein